ncbi:hypothetical protein PVL29_015941 [Vitis rotundifolia]|uniref:Uncharacterized protein n=1 Tax=Vitis rotundifolia TaxID=103349 RepID=A0AA39DKG8_VITRO|nr:hypothetical protein PVL29_015941 [Vitis rotundifolia]
MLYNSVGFNWLACPAATELEMARGVGGSSRVVGISPARTTIVGGKKEKLNRTVRREPFGSSDSPVGPPVYPVQFRSDHSPVQLTRPNRNPDRPTVRPVGPAGPVRFLKPCLSL